MNDCCNKKMSGANLRDTETRRVLLTILHESTKPLAPPEIVTLCHTAGRNANKTTIYRDLSAMERAGIVQRVIVSDRKQYFELTERGHHHHFICLECNAVEDILLDELDLSKQEASLAQKRGFSVFQHSLEFFGLCKMCQ
jgi:Fur family ferric uptake transcriptional regulator